MGDWSDYISLAAIFVLFIIIPLNMHEYYKAKRKREYMEEEFEHLFDHPERMGE